MTLEPGTTLGRYQVLAPLGHGGMASVYKAFQPALERVVALKVLRPAYAHDPEFLERFRREAKAIARLRHPHIVQVHDFEEGDGQVYLVMEHIEGGTLKQRLSDLARQGQRLPPAEVGRIVREVAEGLGHAHAQGIVHRDVKPSNVMLTRDGKAVVTDFGIAKILAAAGQTQTGIGVGTPEYMSPEQGQASAGVDHRSDIYSLGVLAYELLVGRVPFAADTPLAVMLAHVRDPLPLPSKLDPRIGPKTEQVLLRALAKDPSARYGAATELAAALDEALALESERAAVAPTLARRDARAVRASALPSLPRAVTLPLPPSSFLAGLAGGVLVLALLGGGAAVLGVFGGGSPSATQGPSAAAASSPPGATAATSQQAASTPLATAPSTARPTATLPPSALSPAVGTLAVATQVPTAAPAPAPTVFPPSPVQTATLPPPPPPSPTLDPNAPRFRVVGRVTSVVTGAGLANVAVHLIWEAHGCCEVTATGQTDSSGTFTASVANGSYRVWFRPPVASVHAPQWWRGAPGFGGATIIRIQGADLIGIDAALATGFVVSGRVTEPATGNPAMRVFVTLNRNACATDYLDIAAGVNPDGQGNYSVRLPNGTYYALANSEFWRIQYWNGMTACDAATPIVVSGSDVRGIDFRLVSR